MWHSAGEVGCGRRGKGVASGHRESTPERSSRDKETNTRYLVLDTRLGKGHEPCVFTLRAGFQVESRTHRILGRTGVTRRPSITHSRAATLSLPRTLFARSSIAHPTDVRRYRARRCRSGDCLYSTDRTGQNERRTVTLPEPTHSPGAPARPGVDRNYSGHGGVVTSPALGL